MDCPKKNVWHDFVNAGIIQLKDICYEVTEGFLPENAIIEMFQDVHKNCNFEDIKNRYKILKSALPEEWCNIVKTEIHERNKPRSIDVNISVKHKSMDLKSCSTKVLYSVLCNKICRKPTSYTKWIEEVYVDENLLSKVWSNVFYHWKPPCMIELDFKVGHHCIFTNSKLFKIGLSDTTMCNVCEVEDETMVHLFLKCQKLQTFHDYIYDKILVLFQNCESTNVNLVEYEDVMLFGFVGKYKGVNIDFINFMLSVARYCIFRRRNIVKLSKSNVDIIRLFRYTLKHFVSYYYEYLCKMKNMDILFEKKFINNNTIIKRTEDILIFDL